MSKVIVWTSLAVFFVGMLQTAVLSHITAVKVMPDIVLLIIVYAAISNGSKMGMICGFIAGLLSDFLSAAPLGLSSFILTLAGFIIGRLCGVYNVSKVFLPALLGLSGFLFKAALLFGLNFVFGKNIHVYNIFHINFLTELVLNTVCAPLVFLFLNMFSSTFKMREFPVYE